MSALAAPPMGEHTGPARVGRGSSRLRAVPPLRPRLARAPFLLVMVAVFGLGMAGLLMLNTTLQNQAFESRALSRQVTELVYTEADLQNQVNTLAAPPELARQASALGMRPNPHPAVIVLPDGKVLGEPTPVTGAEVPSLVVKTPAELAQERAEKEAKQQAAAAKKAREAARRAAQQQAAREAERREAADAAATSGEAEQEDTDR